MVPAPGGPGHQAGPSHSLARDQDRFPPRPPRQASGRPGRRIGRRRPRCRPALRIRR